MKTIPHPVPQGHGLYLLIHNDPPLVYVGGSTNLRGRAYEWKGALNRGQFEYPASEWQFVVVQRTEGMSPRELRDEETKLIENIKKRGYKVLNKMFPATPMRFTVDGIEGSATFHASRLGKNPAGVLDKLHRGYTIEEALGKSIKEYDHRADAIERMAVKLVQNGEYITYKEAASVLGRSKEAVSEKAKRIKQKYPGAVGVEIPNFTPIYPEQPPEYTWGG